MENKPLIIIGSARENGNTNHFVTQVFKNIIHKEVNLLNYHVSPYNYEGVYPDGDQFDSILVELLAHQTIILATPVYWYSMSAIMKNFFDRITDLVTVRKEVGRLLKSKTVSLIAVGTDPELPDGFEIPFKLTAAYLEMDYKQRIYFTEDEKDIGEQKRNEINLFLNRLP
jgi:putative NADPH-quinone reductase